jgi:hypothetical protein
MSAVRSNEPLWEAVKSSIHKGTVGGPKGTWNARKAQLAVKKYKDMGGKYIGAKKHNSLVKWTEENWGYIDGVKGNRYLPEKIRKQLTPAEKATENKLKATATKKGIQHAKYSKSVLIKMRKK